MAAPRQTPQPPGESDAKTSDGRPPRASNATADLPTLLLLLAMYLLLVGNHVLYWTSPLPLVVHILISSAAIHLAFTVWHEAAHKNVSHAGWLNDVVGVVGMLPYMTPFFMQKWVHLQHHKRLNEPDDPNLIYTDGPFRTIFLRYPRALGYAKKLISEDPRTRGEQLSDLAFLGVVGALYAAALWFGVLLDVILLWFVPVIVAKVMMDWYINYLPHVGLPPDRFLGTRIVDVAWLTPLILLHNYHAIHHLWPYVPWHRYRSIFRDKIEYLRENGVPIEHAVLGDRSPRAALDPQDTLSG